MKALFLAETCFTCWVEADWAGIELRKLSISGLTHPIRSYYYVAELGFLFKLGAVERGGRDRPTYLVSPLLRFWIIVPDCLTSVTRSSGTFTSD